MSEAVAIIFCSPFDTSRQYVKDDTIAPDNGIMETISALRHEHSSYHTLWFCLRTGITKMMSPVVTGVFAEFGLGLKAYEVVLHMTCGIWRLKIVANM